MKQITEKAGKFYRILRDVHPNTPIVFIENPIYPHSKYNLNLQKTIQEKNKALNIVFDELKAKNEQHIWLIHAVGMTGLDEEATVDGIHFTDLGFIRYADFLYPKIQEIIGK